MTFYIQICALVLVCFHAAVRFRYELQMLQQNSYRLDRYGRWLAGNLADVDRIVDLLMLAVAVGASFTFWIMYGLGAVGILSLYKGIRLLRTKYKKPLVFTARATRIYTVGIVLMVAAVVCTLRFAGIALVSNTLFTGIEFSGFLALALTVFSPLWISLVLVLLMPVEAAVNRWYVNDARRILREMPNLTIIGITGSYGKTSTKHYLHRILSERFSVVMTPGSFNTTLGVVRTIREQLKPYTEVFIVEMGAKQPGDIAEICNLVHPSIGIITSVGEQHLESFKTIDNVQRTKFELVNSLPRDGAAILNDDFEYIANRPVENVSRVLRYTSDPARRADYRISDIRYGAGDTSFAVISPDGTTSEPLITRLAGVHNLSNILAGYIAARVLGMTEGEIRYAVGQIEQVEHRLCIKRMGGLTIIDDAFNSNPHGAAMALDVLGSFSGGQRIVVTPGMIELGAKQHELNRTFGRQMASHSDFAVVVGELNRAAILEGLSEGGFDPARIYAARDFADATRKVREIARQGDIILYENDLPDTFK